MRNKVQLIGHLGANPEVKEFESGKTLVRFSLATNEIYKNQQGETVKETQWHNVVAWGKTAKNIEKILQKGNEVAIEGKLHNRSYEDKSGTKRYSTEVLAEEFLLLKKSEN